MPKERHTVFIGEGIYSFTARRVEVCEGAGCSLVEGLGNLAVKVPQWVFIDLIS